MIDSLTRAVTRPAAASHGERLERLVTILLYGSLSGVLAAMSMYTFRYQALSLPWASESLLAVTTLFAGATVKWLVEDMRASIAAFLLSMFVGTAALAGFQILPYVVTGGGPLALRLYLPFRDIVTFLFMIQYPLQLVGYLSVVVTDGYRT